MAYMNQDTKKRIAGKLKQVMPKGWQYSLAVRNHSTIVCTVKAAPFDVLAARAPSPYGQNDEYIDVNKYHYRNHFTDECLCDVFEAIFDALNDGNHDRSDIQTDYFDVGWYAELRFGRWDQPFVVLPAGVEIPA